MRFKPSSLLLTLSKWALSLGMLAYILHEIDVDDMREMLLRQSPWVVPLGLALFLLQLSLASCRWHRLLGCLANHIPMPRVTLLFQYNWICSFFNSCLPGTIGGDVVRVMLLKGLGFPLTLSVHSVLIDRLFAVLGVLAMVLLLLPRLGVLIPELPIGTLYIVTGLCMLVGLWLLRHAPSWLHRLAPGRLQRLLHPLLEHLHTLLHEPRALIVLLLYSILGHIAYCLCCIMLVGSLGGELSLLDSLTLIPPVILLTLLPISVGGWGMREISMVGFLALAGVPKHVALAVSVQLGLFSMLFNLPGAWYYARLKKT